MPPGAVSQTLGAAPGGIDGLIKGQEVYMSKYTRRLGAFLSVLIFILGVMAVSASAQSRTRRIHHRPVIIRHYWGFDPFWRSSWYYDPYMYDPFLREQRDRYYKEKAVRDARKKLDKDRAKYESDGVLTAKEAEKLMKRRHDYEKAVSKLNEFNRDRS